LWLLAAIPDYREAVSLFFSVLFSLFLSEEQKVNEEDCRTSSESTCVVPDPPIFTDVETLTVACNPGC
jgi:hypothetical protein